MANYRHSSPRESNQFAICPAERPLGRFLRPVGSGRAHRKSSDDFGGTDVRALVDFIGRSSYGGGTDQVVRACQQNILAREVFEPRGSINEFQAVTANI